MQLMVSVLYSFVLFDLLLFYDFIIQKYITFRWKGTGKYCNQQNCIQLFLNECKIKKNQLIIRNWLMRITLQQQKMIEKEKN